jgi:hypothetical protein
MRVFDQRARIRRTADADERALRCHPASCRVCVLIAARDGENARRDHVRERGSRASGKQRANLSAIPPLGHRQQHDVAIRRKPSAIESGRDLFGRNGWKRKRPKTIIDHGRRGVAMRRMGWRQQPNPTLRHRFPSSPASNRRRHE